MNDRNSDPERINELVKEMITVDPPETVHSGMDAVLQRFRNELPDHPYVRSLEKGRKELSLLSSLTLMRLTPAGVAAVVIAVVVVVAGGLSIRRLVDTPVVWAEVADQVGDIDRVMFSMSIKIHPSKRGRGSEPAVTETDMTYYLSAAYGFRWDVQSGGEPLMSWYVTPGGDSMVVVNHEEEEWLRLPVGKQDREPSPISPGEDPEEYFRRFIARGYTELGRSEIDGVAVEGIEVTDPPVGEDAFLEGLGRLWVNPRSGLPVRLELEGQVEGQRMEWAMDFRWGRQVDVEEFAPVIPPGFTQPPPGNN